MSDITLLGPQFRAPVLADIMSRTGAAGPIAVVSAGWQEREGELDELRRHLAQPVQELGLYARAERVFGRDPEFAAAYRKRQSRLQQLQELYRVRLGHAKAAVREIEAHGGDAGLIRQARRAAIAALRQLDRQHYAGLTRVRRLFELKWHPSRRPAVAREIAHLKEALDRAGSVLIAGGHVAVLANRLELFAMQRLLKGKRLLAWSAGAMAMTERIVLFHDHPPQGAGNAEVFESGLGLVRELIALPHASARLALSDTRRVALFAQRFAPALCLTLEHGSWAHWHRGRLVAASLAHRLTRRGEPETLDSQA